MLEKVNSDLVTAMKEQDKFTLSVLRMLKSALKNEEINKKSSLTDDEVLAVIKKQVKTRKDSKEEYLTYNRTDLADNLEKEIEILKSLIGKKIININYTYPVYGNIKIDFDSCSIVISNLMHEGSLAGDDDDITYFTLEKISKEDKFEFFLNDVKTDSIKVNETIKSIEIINDLINYNDEYEISYDVAIVFITDKHKYIISRDWFYMETMQINVDKDIDDILDKNTIIEQYRGESTEVKVEIERTSREI